MIVRSVFTVSCLSCGALLALTETLASRSDEPHADSLEISHFLPSFFWKMAIFDKTDSLSFTCTSDGYDLTLFHFFSLFVCVLFSLSFSPYFLLSLPFSLAIFSPFF